MKNTDLMYEENDTSLRPQYLDEYVGQKELKEMMNVFIQTAKKKKKT